MGYILPINHEQYNQYANRIVRKDRPPFKLKRVQKITMNAKLKGKTDYEAKYDEAETIKKYMVKNNAQEDRNDNPSHEHDVDDHLAAELTGKGQKFDEMV